jgi:membrane-associated phospholipid phosphatase
VVRGGSIGAVPEQSDPTPQGPPEERLAERLEASGSPRGSAIARALHEVAQLDVAVYRAVAQTPMPTLDEPLRRLSDLANNSKLWFAIAGGMFVLGGRAGRRAALTGAAAIAINSAIVNVPIKYASRRERPDRPGVGVPEHRWVDMPTSTSFPSGHSASGFAFASAVAGTLPIAAVPVRGLAAAVAYSRVHTGVHYPGDVVVGSLIGVSIGEATALIARGLSRRRAARRRGSA